MSNTIPRLLIVDDDEINRKLLARIFKRTCEVHLADNGRHALEQMVAHRYDVILLDIMMPGLSGLDVLKIIRHSRDMLELPVVLISAITDTSDVARGIRLGANDYITKPVEVDIVQARVNTQVMLKKAMDERSRMIQQLETANAIKGHLMQVASKDLTQPLSNLRMLHTVMQKQAGENPNLQKLLHMADESLETMLRVTENALDHPLMHSAEGELALETVDIHQALERARKEHSSAAYRKGIRLVVEEAQGLVRGDPNRLHASLSNLLRNAIEYSPKDSTVTLCARRRDDEAWRLCVVDEGPGIQESERKHLFQPFSAAKIGTQPMNPDKSTGLGLWMVKELTELQGGTVGMAPTPAGGSVFWVELAAVQAARAGA